MLSNTLNTNEIKNAAGTEQEFQHLDQDGRSHEFALISEPPATPHRLKVQHLETGTGINKRRRSVVRFDKTIMSTVDSALPVTVSAYAVLDAPIGALVANTEMANVLANLMSFIATTGGGTTVLFDGTGNGAQALLTGGL
jgi:hypothetical protein